MECAGDGALCGLGGGGLGFTRATRTLGFLRGHLWAGLVAQRAWRSVGGEGCSLLVGGFGPPVGIGSLLMPLPCCRPPLPQVRTKDHRFESVSHLISYHMDNHLPIISAGSEMCLQQPVERRL